MNINSSGDNNFLQSSISLEQLPNMPKKIENHDQQVSSKLKQVNLLLIPKHPHLNKKSTGNDQDPSCENKTFKCTSSKLISQGRQCIKNSQAKVEQQSPQDKDNKNKMRIPSSIDDVDTIQLNQSNPGMGLKKTIQSSQNTVKQIRSSVYTKRGFFLRSDTPPKDKQDKTKIKIIELLQQDRSEDKPQDTSQDQQRSSLCMLI